MDGVQEGIVQHTADYDKFSLIASNRDIYKPHVQKLVNSFEQHPDIARTRPILVNERYEIIDGQHRYEALKELKKPIYYIIERGLTIQDAQRLNSVQRNWTVADFARSFALTGNEQYIQYLELMEEYQFPHMVLMAYAAGYQRHAATRDFKEGRFKLMKDRKTMRQRLDMLKELTAVYPPTLKSGQLCMALLEAFKNETFDWEHFYEKFKNFGEAQLSNFTGTRNDWLRQLENIYNRYTDRDQQIRLF